MMRTNTTDHLLARVTVMLSGGTHPVAVELIEACRARGMRAVNHQSDATLQSHVATLDPRTPVVRVTFAGESHLARGSSLPAGAKGAFSVIVHAAWTPVCNQVPGTHVHHGPLNPVWTDCRGDRHEGDGGPGSRSPHDVAEQVVHEIVAIVASSTAGRVA